jgi:hypothetical protein
VTHPGLLAGDAERGCRAGGPGWSFVQPLGVFTVQHAGSAFHLARLVLGAGPRPQDVFTWKAGRCETLEHEDARIDIGAAVRADAARHRARSRARFDLGRQFAREGQKTIGDLAARLWLTLFHFARTDGRVTVFERSLMEWLAEAVPNLGFSEYRLPTTLAALGAAFHDPHKLGRGGAWLGGWWAPGAVEVPREHVDAEMAKPDGWRVFHPVKSY